MLLEVIWSGIAQAGVFFWSNLPQIIDILVVATVFYYLFVYVRGTKTAVVIQGIVILALVYIICSIFDLYTVVFILNSLSVIGPLALIIVFAPEIRKALERAGTTSRLIEWLIPREEEESSASVIEVVTDTVVELASQRTGGLLVFERRDEIDDFIVPGTRLDAVVSEHLLTGLFNKYNPLHDGAVLVRNERIFSAGNFLPISENTTLSDELGTRHRAAVGLTERCDAVVVIASEERGEMSIAYNGRLARHLNVEQFVEQLSALIDPNENFASTVPRAAFV
jgi:diadenylate cyclase